MPSFLTVADVELIHSVAIERHGGSSGLRDPGLLASAVHAPQNVHFYELGDREDLSIYEWALLAAAYWYHIAQGQMYADGNKRTAFMAAKAFLLKNGYTLLTPYVAQLLVERTGWSMAPGAMIALVAIAVLPVFLAMRETAPLSGRPTPSALS